MWGPGLLNSITDDTWGEGNREGCFGNEIHVAGFCAGAIARTGTAACATRGPRFRAWRPTVQTSWRLRECVRTISPGSFPCRASRRSRSRPAESSTTAASKVQFFSLQPSPVRAFCPVDYNTGVWCSLASTPKSGWPPGCLRFASTMSSWAAGEMCHVAGACLNCIFGARYLLVFRDRSF